MLHVLDQAMIHVHSLTLQGTLITSVIQALSRSAIGVCSSSVKNLPTATFKFVSKALLNQVAYLLPQISFSGQNSVIPSVAYT